LLHWRKLALTYPSFAIATAIAGGLFAFTYSYIPLHTVELRTIERLEATVSAREGLIAALEDQLAEKRSELEQQPDAASIAELEAERDAARSARAAAERERDEIRTRVAYLERERGEWKRKIARLESDLSARSKAVQLAASEADDSMDGPQSSISPEHASPLPSEIPAVLTAPGRAVAGAEPPMPIAEELPAAPVP